MLYYSAPDVPAENFRLSLQKLERLCLGAGIKADFSHILAAADSPEGLQHREEIYAQIRQAKGFQTKCSNLAACKDVKSFMTWVNTIVEITRMQEFREAADLPQGVTSEQMVAVKSLQSHLSSHGSSFEIDLSKAFGDNADPVYQVQVYDTMLASFGDHSVELTSVENAPSHPVFSNKDKLLEAMNFFIANLRHN